MCALREGRGEGKLRPIDRSDEAKELRAAQDKAGAFTEALRAQRLARSLVCPLLYLPLVKVHAEERRGGEGWGGCAAPASLTRRAAELKGEGEGLLQRHVGVEAPAAAEEERAAEGTGRRRARRGI